MKKSLFSVELLLGFTRCEKWDGGATFRSWELSKIVGLNMALYGS